MPGKDYKKSESKQPGAGASTFDRNKFMYEVADEIRAGLDEDKKKAAPGQGYETAKPFEKQPAKKASEFGKKDTECEKK